MGFDPQYAPRLGDQIRQSRHRRNARPRNGRARPTARIQLRELRQEPDRIASSPSGSRSDHGCSRGRMRWQHLDRPGRVSARSMREPRNLLATQQQAIGSTTTRPCTALTAASSAGTARHDSRKRRSTHQGHHRRRGQRQVDMAPRASRNTHRFDLGAQPAHPDESHDVPGLGHWTLEQSWTPHL